MEYDDAHRVAHDFPSKFDLIDINFLNNLKPTRGYLVQAKLLPHSAYHKHTKLEILSTVRIELGPSGYFIKWYYFSSKKILMQIPLRVVILCKRV